MASWRSETVGSYRAGRSWRRVDAHVARVDDLLPGEVDASKRLVLVLVGSFDLRATVPLEYAWRRAARERRALHVAVDEAGLWALGERWMELARSLPLFTVEDDGGIARSVASVVELELATFDEVVVLAGRIGLGRRVHRLLHDRTADAISTALSGMPRVVTAITTVATT